MNIYEKLSEITAEISAVAKNLEVGFGANRYKAVGEADVLRAVKPIEKKHGVYSYPYSREVIESGTMEKENSKGGKTVSLFMRVKTVYRFVNLEKPDEYVDIVTFGDGVDSQDKAPGKAMTYGDKYALLKAYKIVTGDDPDQNASEPQSQIDVVAVSRQKIGAVKVQTVRSMCTTQNVPESRICTLYKVDSIDDLTEIQFKNLCDNWEKVRAMG
jgi:hypothetical protein